MKYIRTKDGRIFPTKAKEEDIDKSIYADVADTIEELCDELVVHNPNNDPEYFPQWFVYRNDWKNVLNEKSANFKKEHYEKEIEVYGAIWTDKGLTYVAKMNDEGKLELL